jgi:hypothetical protein
MTFLLSQRHAHFERNVFMSDTIADRHIPLFRLMLIAADARAVPADAHRAF